MPSNPAQPDHAINQQMARLKSLNWRFLTLSLLICTLNILGLSVIDLKLYRTGLSTGADQAVHRLHHICNNIFQCATLLGHASNPEDHIDKCLPEIIFSVSHLESNYKKTISSLKKYNQPVLPWQKASSVLESKIENFPGVITKFITKANNLRDSITSKQRDPKQISQISLELLELETQLIRTITSLSQAIGQEVEVQMDRLAQRSQFLSGSILILLLVQLLLIFRPIVVTHKKSLKQLLEANRRIESDRLRLLILKDELTQRNQDLQQSLAQIHQMHHMLMAQTGPASYYGVAQSVARQIQVPAACAQSCQNQILSLIQDIQKQLRDGMERIPLRILDQLEFLTSNLQTQISFSQQYLQDIQDLLTVLERFKPTQNITTSPERLQDHQDKSLPPLNLQQLFYEIREIFQAAGPSVDPLDPDNPQSVLETTTPDPFPLQIVCDADDQITINIDREGFISVILELLRNSARSTRLKSLHGPIPKDYRRIIGLVAHLESANNIVIKVMDNGYGMSPDMRARAVEPFFTTKPGGLGMGLTFVQDFVVHKMQGQLVLDDNVGGGLCVKIICSSFTPH